MAIPIDEGLPLRKPKPCHLVCRYEYDNWGSPKTIDENNINDSYDLVKDTSRKSPNDYKFTPAGPQKSPPRP